MDSPELARYKEVAGHFATGVTVVTAMVDGEPVGFTCQSFASLSLEPLLVGFAARSASSSWPKVREAGLLAINILDDDSEALGRAFATSGTDKFAGVAHHPGPNGAPILDATLAVITADIIAVHAVGDHDYAVARVGTATSRHGKPLLYFRGGFGTFTSD